MAVERVNTPEFNLIVGDNWPELNEDTYAARAGEQYNNSLQLTDGAATVNNMAASVADNMQGLTADASAAQSEQRAGNLNARGTVLMNRAVGVGLAGQNILNVKNELNTIATGYESQWEAIKVQAVAEGWDQAQLQEAKDALVDEFKGQADSVGASFEQTDNALKEQITAGAEPSVPSTMQGGSGGLELPQGLDSQMQSMLGQGMGMAQSLPQSLQGAVTPLGEQGQQALDKVLQAVQGGSGNVNVTPEMLDEMLAGQESGDSGSGGSDSGASSASEGDNEDGFQGENPSGAAEATPVSMNTGGDAGADAGDDAGGDAGGGADEVSNVMAEPSPAESPVTAAPPESAMMPETQLSGDTGSSAPSSDTASNVGAGGAGGTGGAGAANALRGDDQGVSHQAPVSDGAAGTHLTSDTMTSPSTATSGAGGLGAPAAGGLGAPMGAGGLGAGGLGTGMNAGGLGAGASMGAPSMGTPMGGTVIPGGNAPTPPSPAAAAPAAPAAAPAAPGASTAAAGTAAPTAPGVPATAGGAGAAQLGAPAAGAAGRDGATAAGVVPAAVPAGAYPGAVQHMSDARYTDAERRAGSVAASVTASFTRAGIVTPVAVALLNDGLAVFTTADGLGVLPHNVSLPEDVIPLSEIVEVNELFRQDMTGCLNPGYVMKTVVELGLLEDVRSIIATDNGTTEGVTYVTPNALKGAPHLSLVVHRDQFSGIATSDIPEAIETLRIDWGITEKLSAEEAQLNLTLARWETVSDPLAAKVLATWLVADAEDSVSKGRLGEAAYVLMQALHLGEPQG